MLSEIKLVRVKKAIDKLYDGTCTVVERREYIRPTKATGFKEVTTIMNQPCRLVYKTLASSEQTDTGASLTQVTKLLLDPEVVINPGSRITVTQNGIVEHYKRSGEPAVYATHQEIVLQLWKKWA